MLHLTATANTQAHDSGIAGLLRRLQELGIEFKDWGHLGNRFFHGFGDFGPDIEGRSPHMVWMRLAKLAGQGERLSPAQLSVACAPGSE